MKYTRNITSWDVTLYRSVKAHRIFWEFVSSFLLSSWLAYLSTLMLRQYVTSKRRRTSTERSTCLLLWEIQFKTTRGSQRNHITNKLKSICTMKSTIFCDIRPCGPLKVSRRFGGICRLHFQGWRISRARNQREIRWQTQLFCLPSASSTLKMEAVYSSEIFIDFQRTIQGYIAVRTSNPTICKMIEKTEKV
jgi:hypothetical protein